MDYRDQNFSINKNYDVWNGQFAPQDANRFSAARPHSLRDPQVMDNQGFIDNKGRRCRIVCESTRRPMICDSQTIIGRNIRDARLICPNIREVIRDGLMLPKTNDYRYNRMNVWTRNGVIIHFAGYY